MIFNYSVYQHNDGSTSVYYKLPTGQTAVHVVPIKKLVYDYINSNINKARSIIKRFETQDIDNLLNDKEIIEIINNIEDSDINTNKDIKQFNKKQLLKAYNKLHNTTIIFEEL